MLRKILTALLILYVALILPASALAQSSYSFGVPLESVDVSWNSDGSEALQYAITFVNQSGAAPIDFVDVGMPNSNFDMSTVTADVNGHNVSVSQSGYQGSGSGFSVVMGAQRFNLVSAVWFMWMSARSPAFSIPIPTIAPMPVPTLLPRISIRNMWWVTRISR